MKTKTKALVLGLCAVLLVVTTVFVTMAFLTSNDRVTNTFTVGNVKITLDEAKVDGNGKANNDADRVKENAYKLIPGHEYDKDPTVHVDANSEDCWLFVKVENGLEAIIEGPNTIDKQMTDNGWTKIDDENNIWAYNRAVTKEDQNVKVFDGFTVKGDVSNLEDYNNKTIVVTAYAIQKDGFDTAAAAWEAAGSEFNN